jgi:hypothetical protein
MVDQVARALCEAAGKAHIAAECSCCEVSPDGIKHCIYWEAFRGEARAAIQAAYTWNKKERRWPGFCR